MSDRRICEYCRSELPPDAAYCPYCGAEPVTPPPATPPPVPVTPSPATPVTPATQPFAVPQSTTLSITAFVLAIVGFAVIITFIPALIVGLIALKKEPKGKVFAWIAVGISGGILLIIVVLMIIALIQIAAVPKTLVLTGMVTVLVSFGYLLGIFWVSFGDVLGGMLRGCYVGVTGVLRVLRVLRVREVVSGDYRQDKV